MKLVKTSKDEWRRERNRATNFTLALVAGLAIAWPIIGVSILESGDGAVMEDVAFESWETHVVVDEDGREVVEEVVEVEFLEPGRYVRAVGELSSTQPKVRYFSTPLSAEIDGEEVGIATKYSGVGGKYYELEEELDGLHTVTFSYAIENSIYSDEANKGIFRSRLLPRYSLSEVKSFKAVIEVPSMVTEEAECWTSEAVKDPEEEDKCDFKELNSTRAVIELEDLDYLRPVRFSVPVEGSYEAARLPWTGYWDNILGRSSTTPLLIFANSLLALFVSPFVARRLNWSDHTRVVFALSGAGVLLLGFGGFFAFIPSLAFLLPACLLWPAVPAYVRLSEARLLSAPPDGE